MSIKSFFAIPFAKIATRKVFKWAEKPHKTQEKVFKHLLSKGGKTAFGKDHNFDTITNYEDFKKEVSVTDYEGLKTYVDRVVAGESDVLWTGKPFILQKLLEQLLALNTSQSQKNRCLHISKLLEMRYYFISQKKKRPVLSMEK